MFVGVSVLALMVVVSPVRGELFTALVHMESLLDLERELLSSLNSYITAEKERYSAVLCQVSRNRIVELLYSSSCFCPHTIPMSFHFLNQTLQVSTSLSLAMFLITILG